MGQVLALIGEATNAASVSLKLEELMAPVEQRQVAGLFELGAGPHRSGDIAMCFSAAVSSLAPTRSSLVTKGMVWSPNHGDSAFTVPVFDEFMKRIMPGNDWR